MSTESAEPQVTFVGGKAVEQTESLGNNLEADEYDAAKEAVRKAIQEAGETAAEDAKSNRGKDPYKPVGTKKDSEKEADGDEGTEESDSGPKRGPDGKFLPRDGSTPKPAVTKPKGDNGSADEGSEEELDLDKASVKQLLKAREKVANLKKSANDEMAKEREAIQRQAAEVRQAYAQLQQMQQEIQRQHAAVQALKTDPARAVKELGIDPEEYIMNLAMENTPEGQQRRQQQEIHRQLEEIRQWREQLQQQEQERAYRAHMEAAKQARVNAVQTFVGLGTNEEKYPHVSTFYKGREKLLIAAGDLIAEEYRNLSGKEGSFEQILDYLEDELAESANTWYTKRNPSTQVKTGNESNPKAKVSSKGKSLSPEASGERRALASKDLADLDAEERHEAAKAAVRVALANSK